MQDSFNLRFSPLQGYTDDVYRQAHARCFGGVECYYSPFVRVEHGEIRRKDVRDVEPDNNRGLRLVPQLIASDTEKGNASCRSLPTRAGRKPTSTWAVPSPYWPNGTTERACCPIPTRWNSC